MGVKDEAFYRKTKLQFLLYSLSYLWFWMILSFSLKSGLITELISNSIYLKIILGLFLLFEAVKGLFAPMIRSVGWRKVDFEILLSFVLSVS